MSLAQGHNTPPLVRLEAPQSQVKHSTTEPDWVDGKPEVTGSVNKP